MTKKNPEISQNLMSFSIHHCNKTKHHHPIIASISSTTLPRLSKPTTLTAQSFSVTKTYSEAPELMKIPMPKTVIQISASSFSTQGCMPGRRWCSATIHTVMPDYRDLVIYSPHHNGHDLHSKGHTEIQSTDNSRIMSGNRSEITHSKTDNVNKLNMPVVDLVLLTSMYHSTVKQYLFINTVINWSNLTAPSRLQPVLFLTNMDIVEKSGILLYVAYIRGWIIAVAPECLKSRYPLLHSMFHFGRDVVPNANWYGYSNGDIQFTSGFMKTIIKINQYNTHINETDKPIVFISSKHTDVYVPRGELYTDPNDIITLSQGTEPQSGIAIDLFVYHQNSTEVFREMPRFAVGRQGFDNWLIHDILHRGLGSVEITGTSPMVHLGINDLNIHENSHRTRVEDGEYNIHIINDTSRQWVKMVEDIGTVSQLWRTGGNGSPVWADYRQIYRQWLAEEHDIKFSLKSRVNQSKIVFI